MMYDGRRYTKARTFGWRNADGEIYAEGAISHGPTRIPYNHVVIFRIADAKTSREGDRIYYDPNSVPKEKCIPICAHTATNVALGVPKIVSRAGATINIGRRRGERTGHGQPFVEQAHYLVHDGQVYVWKSRRIPKPEDSPALQGVPQVTLEKP